MHSGFILLGKAEEFLVDNGPFRCIFADIPDNLGLKYNGYKDDLPMDVYRNWCEILILRALQKSEIFWLSYNAAHALWMQEILGRILRCWFPSRTYKQIVWTFTFGQYKDEDFTSCYRPVALMTRADVKLNYDAIRIPSARMELGDSRAAGPRVPGDVWEYPRVVGNAKERRTWHVTQHPEALMERIILLSCSETIQGRTEPRGTVVDVCLGSGTTGIVAQRLHTNWIGVDVSEYYCEQACRELDGVPRMRVEEFTRTQRYPYFGMKCCPKCGHTWFEHDENGCGVVEFQGEVQIKCTCLEKPPPGDS